MVKLIQLPNGDWIDPLAVKGIKAVVSFDAGPDSVSPRVMVLVDSGPMARIDYASFEDACAGRDAIGRVVNEARKKGAANGAG